MSSHELTKTDVSKIVDQYNKDGFVQVKSLFSKEELAEIEKQLANFCKNDAPKLKGRDINYADGQINSIHALSQNSKYFYDLMRQPKVTELVKLMLNDDVEFRHMEFFAKPAKVGMPSPMHQDNFYWCIAGGNGLTAWIALDYCDTNNGGLTYYKGTHKKGTIDHMDSFAPGSSQTIKDREMLKNMESVRVTPVLEPGDVLFHHADLIHGSEANKSDRSRRGLTMQFKGENSIYDKTMLAHYESRLYEQIRMREAAAAKAVQQGK